MYYVKTKFRKHSNNKINKFDSRYWCWFWWNCFIKFAISQNKLHFSILHINIASKYSISTTIKINFATFKNFNSIRLMIFWRFFLVVFEIFLLKIDRRPVCLTEESNLSWTESEKKTCLFVERQIIDVIILQLINWILFVELAIQLFSIFQSLSLTIW